MSKYVKVSDVEKCKMTLVDAGVSDYYRGQAEGWNAAIDMITTELAVSMPRGSNSKKGRTWLRDLRIDRRMLQGEMAKLVGISQTTYASYENLARTPRPKVAKKIADALGFNWTRFYEEEEK